jgi:hypothetical protein
MTIPYHRFQGRRHSGSKKDFRYQKKHSAIYGRKLSPTYMLPLGARDVIVVEALRYKPEGRGFDSRWSLNLFIDIILPVALRPWGRLSP